MARRWGLRTEVGVHLGVLLAAALILSGVVQLKIAEQELVRIRISHAQSTMELAAAQLTNPVGMTSDSWVRRLGTLDLGGRVLWGVLLDDKGEVRGRFGSRDAPPEMREFRRALLTSEIQADYRPARRFLPLWPGPHGLLRLTVPGTERSPGGGAVQFEIELTKAWPDFWYAVNMMLFYALIFGLILLLFGMSVLHKGVIKPVQQLQKATRYLAGQSFPEPLPLEGPRELAELTASFNEMTAALSREQACTQDTITQLKAANRSLEQAQDELVRSEKMASVGHLAAGMAHEIGNPLGATLGYLSLLKGDLEEGEQRDLVERSLAEMNRIDRLVKDLLDYARPSGPGDEWIQPGEVLTQAADLLNQQGALKGIVLENNLPATLPKVRLSRHKLVQVGVNLLLNARDAMEGKGSIRLEGHVNEEQVTLAIVDTGPGMSEEVRRHLFDPFFTTKGPGEGRGLGLAVCQRVMAEAGGRIEVESAPGQGSCFELIFPREGDG